MNTQIAKTKSWMPVLWLMAALCTPAGCDISLPGESGGHGNIDQNLPVDGIKSGLSWGDTTETVDGVHIPVLLNRHDGHPGPRTVELWVAYSESLQFVAAEKGESLISSMKVLVVQDHGDRVRLVIFGTASLERIQEGELTTLHFRRQSDGPATVNFVAQMPIFAPADAQQGLQLAEPLNLGGM